MRSSKHNATVKSAFDTKKCWFRLSIELDLSRYDLLKFHLHKCVQVCLFNRIFLLFNEIFFKMTSCTNEKWFCYTDRYHNTSNYRSVCQISWPFRGSKREISMLDFHFHSIRSYYVICLKSTISLNFSLKIPFKVNSNVSKCKNNIQFSISTPFLSPFFTFIEYIKN